MNVIIANEKSDIFSTLDIDIIKSINGIYDTNELSAMFKSFFYSRMIIDVTAFKLFEDISTYASLVKELDASKIILFLKEGSAVCTSNFLSKLIDLGIYNFTTNIEGIKYLLNKPNTLDDVKQIKQMQATNTIQTGSTASSVVSSVSSILEQSRIIGFRNVTEHAGATTLIYSLKKQLELIIGKKVIAIEVDKQDFSFFNDENMFSVTKDNLISEIRKHSEANIILVDLNLHQDDSCCGDVFYLMEPSIIKINKLLKYHASVLGGLTEKKVILNKSMISNKDVSIFEKEIGFSFFHVISCFNERESNDFLNNFLVKLGTVNVNNENQTGGLFSFLKK